MFKTENNRPSSLIFDFNSRHEGISHRYWGAVFLKQLVNKKVSKKSIKTIFRTTFAPLHFNLWVLKKERCYTKLKYSRTPAYDIVSGGLAAFFAAFLGFLIAEKFGFELLDSADFFLLILYIAITIYSGRLWLDFFVERKFDTFTISSFIHAVFVEIFTFWNVWLRKIWK